MAVEPSDMPVSALALSLNIRSLKLQYSLLCFFLGLNILFFFLQKKNMYIVQECVFYLIFCIQNLFWNSLATFVIWGYSCLPFFMPHSAFSAFCYFLICLLRKIRLSFKIRAVSVT